MEDEILKEISKQLKVSNALKMISILHTSDELKGLIEEYKSLFSKDEAAIRALKRAGKGEQKGLEDAYENRQASSNALACFTEKNPLIERIHSFF